MRIRADEHVAEAIIKAVREIALQDGWALDSVVSARQAGKSDVHWITEFMADGGDAILTARKAGRRTLISFADLESYLASLPTYQAGA